MKRNIYLVFFFSLLTCIASAQVKKSSNFVLKGTFIGKHTQAIFLIYEDSSGQKTKHKAFINNGIFSFKGFISSPVYATIMSDIKIKPSSMNVSNVAEVFLSPGDLTISLKENDFGHPVLVGSVVHNEWTNLQTMYEPLNKIKDSLYQAMFAIERAGNTPKNRIARMAVVAKIDKCNLEIDHIDYNYIGSHPTSYLSAYLLSNCMEMDLRLDSTEMFYNAFSQSVKNSVAGKAISRVIVNGKSSIVGSVIRMPLGTNLDGSRFNPQTFKIDNYILLYFWAGWANDNTDLKAIYNKYQSRGLKTIAISMEPFKKTWRDSIKKGQIGMWHHIFADPVANLDTFYNIKQMAPSLVLLVDKNYTIIGRYRGRGKYYKMGYNEEPMEELDKKLAKIIN